MYNTLSERREHAKSERVVRMEEAMVFLDRLQWEAAEEAALVAGRQAEQGDS